MPALRRWAAPAALTAAVLTLAACGGDDGSGSAGATTAATTTSTTVASTTTAGPTTTRPATPVIEVRVAGGEVQGGVRRERVRRGEAVVLRVVADVNDHVHVHGYDLMADVGPGKPAEIRFAADLPGVWEVELEDRKQPLLTIEVR
jgi:hypothetical protein